MIQMLLLCWSILLHLRGLHCKLCLVPTSLTNNNIHIGATVNKHSEINKHLLPRHALTACDTVGSLYGVRKGKALNIFKQGHCISMLGNIEQHEEDL